MCLTFDSISDSMLIAKSGPLIKFVDSLKIDAVEALIVLLGFQTAGGV